MAQQKEQWFILVALSMFLVGAIFMLINTFGGQEWALWVGTGFAVAAGLLYLIVLFFRRQFNKKYSPRESELKDADVKIIETAEPIVTQEPVVEEKKEKTTSKSKTVKKSPSKTTTKKTPAKKPVTKK